MKIKNSLRSRNLSKIPENFRKSRKILCHVTLVPVVSTSSRYSTSCRTRLHLVGLESLRERTKLYQVYCDVLQQTWERICEQVAILPSMYSSVFRKISWHFYELKDSKEKVAWLWVEKEKWSLFRARSLGDNWTWNRRPFIASFSKNLTIVS